MLKTSANEPFLSIGENCMFLRTSSSEGPPDARRCSLKNKMHRYKALISQPASHLLIISSENCYDIKADMFSCYSYYCYYSPLFLSPPPPLHLAAVALSLFGGNVEPLISQ